jgi:hypothetical protein
VDRPADVPELELYDHRNDPLDQRNVSSEHPEIVTRLSEQLDRWQKWAVEHKLPTNEQATGDMSSEELDRLRSLGYVQ